MAYFFQDTSESRDIEFQSSFKANLYIILGILLTALNVYLVFSWWATNIHAPIFGFIFRDVGFFESVLRMMFGGFVWSFSALFLSIWPYLIAKHFFDEKVEKEEKEFIYRGMVALEGNMLRNKRILLDAKKTELEFCTYDINGRKLSRGQFKNKVRHGNWVFFDVTGKVEQSIDFKNDQPQNITDTDYKNFFCEDDRSIPVYLNCLTRKREHIFLRAHDRAIFDFLRQFNL